MEHTEGGAATEQKCRATVTCEGVAEELELICNWKTRNRLITKIVQRFTDLRDVLLDQMLRADARPGIKRGIAHIAQVMVQAFAESAFEAFHVILLAILLEVAQPVVDDFIMIKVGGKILFPLGVALQKVQFQSRCFPYLVVGRVGQHFPELGYSWILEHR